MRNRSNNSLPAVYVETASQGIGSVKALELSALEVYNVTYLHYHSVLEIGYCVEGEGTCYVEDRAQPFGAGDVQVIFPFQKHLSCNTGTRAGKWYWLNIDLARLAGQAESGSLKTLLHVIYQDIRVFGIFRADTYPDLAALTRKLMEEARDTARPYAGEMRMAMLTALMIALSRLSAGQTVRPVRAPRHFQEIEKALLLVPQCLSDGKKPMVADMAKTCGMSEANFRRVFQRIIGRSPSRYCREARMRQAQQLLLSTNRSISEISQLIGFSDVSGFNRVFLACCGMPPSVFRKNML